MFSYQMITDQDCGGDQNGKRDCYHLENVEFNDQNLRGLLP